MHNALSTEIGRRLRNYRQRIGLTQEELAERAGVHCTYIGQVERGEKNLTISSLEKISRSLQISISDLFEDIEEFTESPDDIALKCYWLIRNEPLENQQHLYNVLLEIEKMK